ncbi:trihelix transcription factor ASIL2 [Rhodamnia argentea]|uniref:Trihelix transcription factor ASIL2 n=1 Tax=Rhodamnia argentea TaxID=178133 RepID=A0A8B8PBL4_9MYRT|nr:trihelix transcription factor ASIL2 [Rhodamnia argentea]
MTDKEANQETPPSLLPNSGTVKLEESPRQSATAGGGDRLKRDEWSEGAVSSLLEAYESKWALRNRAKLKGHDWEDVARFVSSRASCTKSPKTQTQCKNKIESMKKRYRTESAAADASSWPLYPRLDMLLRGTAPPQPPLPPPPLSQPPASNPPPFILLEPSSAAAVPQLLPISGPPPPPPPCNAQNSHGSNGVDKLPKEDGAGTKLSDQLSDKNPVETDSSTPALYSDKQKSSRSKKHKMARKAEKNKKRRMREEYGIAESIRWLAEAIMRSEQSRMETMKELEKMRIEAEARRGEMDLKRTEIIASTQLEIAKLFAGSNKGIDSSLRIGRN